MYTQAFDVDSFLHFPHKKFYVHFSSTWYMPRDLPISSSLIYTSLGVHIITLHSILFCPVSCYLLPSRPTYIAQNPTLEHPQQMFSSSSQKIQKYWILIPKVFAVIL